MSFLVSLLLWLGVIVAPEEVTSSNQAQYEAEYATEENIEAYRGANPIDVDEI